MVLDVVVGAGNHRRRQKLMVGGIFEDTGREKLRL